MKRLVQVKYTQFSEVFEVDLTQEKLDVELKEILQSPKETAEYINLDLSRDFRKSYSDFPFTKGDLSIMQAGNVFIVTLHEDNKVHWLKFDSSQVISYLINNPILEDILPFISEDKHIFLNSVLSDFVRNDYSFNEINKKIKFVKISVIMSFIGDYLKANFERVLLDETLLGDIDIDNIPMAFRFSNKNFLTLIKIDNLSKVIVALGKNKEIDTEFRFTEKLFFVNNQNSTNKLKLLLNNNGLKYDYEVLPQKNYIFSLGDNEYSMEFGDMTGRKVRGKVCVYNGDNRDLMIS